MQRVLKLSQIPFIKGWRRKLDISSSDGSLDRCTEDSVGLLLDQARGLALHLHPPCSEWGVRMNIIQLRKKKYEMTWGGKTCIGTDDFGLRSAVLQKKIRHLSYHIINR